MNILTSDSYRAAYMQLITHDMIIINNKGCWCIGKQLVN